MTIRSTGIDGYQDLETGKLYDEEGNEKQAGYDEGTKAAILKTLEGGEDVVIGNLADLQRLGTLAVVNGKADVADAVSLPENSVKSEDVNEIPEATQPAVDNALNTKLTKAKGNK